MLIFCLALWIDEESIFSMESVCECYGLSYLGGGGGWGESA
jgi:hypothetical protein